MPAERKIDLPDAQKSAQVYLVSQAIMDKLKEADLGYKIVPKAEDFEVQKGGEEMGFSIKQDGPAFQAIKEFIRSATLTVTCSDGYITAEIEWPD
jgi:hypothetical protein